MNTEYLNELYDRAKYLVKNKDNYRSSIKYYDNHKFEFFTYILPAYKQLKEDNAFFMRGFCAINDGEVISPSMHKFFNYKENEDYQHIDYSHNLFIAEKFDGTLIIPVEIDNNIYFRSKNDIDNDYTKFCYEYFKREENKHQYINLIQSLQDIYPFYELLDYKLKNVVDYGNLSTLQPIAYYSKLDDKLILKPMLSNKNLKSNYNSIEEIEQYLESVKNFEGYVIYDFDIDKQYKLKASEYLIQHKAKEKSHSYLYILDSIINEKIDDILPHITNDNIRNEIINIQSNLMLFISNNEKEIRKIVFNYDDKKELAKNHCNHIFSNVMFRFFHNKNIDLIDEIKRDILNRYNKESKAKQFIFDYILK